THAIPMTLDNLRQMFLSPSLNNTTWSNALWQVTITLSLAFLSTILGAVISLFLAFGTAVNLSKPCASNTIKAFITVVRAVLTVLWVLIWGIASALGSVAAAIGIIFHSMASLVKAYSEAFEEVVEGKLEALRPSGASYFHILFQVIVPQTKSLSICRLF